MVQINVTSNAPEISRTLKLIASDQVPFATSKTVNNLAAGVKKIEQSKLDRYFDLRTNWLTKRGAMPIKFSNKRMKPEIFSTLRVVDEVAVLAATGGDRKSEDGGDMAIPYSDTGKNRSTRQLLNPAKRTLPRGKWPSRIVKKGRGKRGRVLKTPKPFYITSKRTGKRYVAKRTDKGSSSLEILYGFEQRVKMKKTWPFIKNVEGYVDRNFERRFRVELRKAIRSAK